MRRFYLSIICLLVSLFVLSCPPVGLADRLTLAVVAFDEIGDVGIPGAGAMIAEGLMDYLEDSPDYQLTERRLLHAALAEQELGLRGVLAPETVRELGRTAGAQAIVTGSVFRPEETLYVTARIIDVEQGEVLRTGKISGPDFDAVMLRIGKLAADLATVDPERPGEVRPRAAPGFPAAPGACGSTAPEEVVVVACGQPIDALLRMGGRVYDFAEKPFLCLPKGSVPFELEIPGRARTVYGRFDVLAVNEDTDGVTFGLRGGGLFKPAHIEAALEGRPVRYTLGVRTAEGQRVEALRYILSLRSLAH